MKHADLGRAKGALLGKAVLGYRKPAADAGNLSRTAESKVGQIKVAKAPPTVRRA